MEKRLTVVAVGQSSQIGGYTVTFEDMLTEDTPERSTVIGIFRIRDADGKDLGTVRSEKSFYATQEQPSTEVGIRSTPMADIYIILASPNVQDRTAAVSYLINPGVYWIWLGGLIVVAGGGVGGGAQRRPRGGPQGGGA